MDYGRFSGEEHPHQQANQDFKLAEPCWCRGATNLGDVKWVQNFMALLKPSIGEEVEKALIRVLQPYLPLLQTSALQPNSSSIPHQAWSSECASRSLQLQFKGDIPDTLYTKTKLEDQLTSLEVELLDESGNRVEDGDESRVKIKINVLNGDFNVGDKFDWTNEDYTDNIVKPREKRGALLEGKYKMALRKGVASVGHIRVTDNSRHTRSETFRLGAIVEGRLHPGVVVKAAVSEEFRVKERRLKGSKHEEPSAEDDLCHLVYIGKNGPVRERARQANINTVKDFLQLYDTNAQELQQILRVTEAKWNAIVKNAKACKLRNMADGSYRYNVDTTNVQILYQHKQQQHNTQGHEHVHLQPLPPPPCRSFDAVGDDPDAVTHISNSNQIGSIPSFNFDSPEADQGFMLGVLQTEESNEKLQAKVQELQELLKGSAPLEERNNVPEVTSKLIAACYVTKAASLFMISIQQDSSAAKKKRKFQSTPI